MPLLPPGSIAARKSQSGLGPALHPGARQFYDKDRPSYISAHADYVGLTLTVLALISSWVWEARSWMQRKQKSIADEYSQQAVALMNGAKEAGSPGGAA